MEGGTTMTALITGISEVTDVVATVFSAITSNTLLAFFVSASLLSVGVGIFRMLKGAARS